MESRIKGERIDIKYEETHMFFEQHGNEGVKHRYNYVLFQDNTPEVAINRDRMEKDKIKTKIDFKEGKRALDIGCGIGRWGEELLYLGLSYTGIDYSKNLLDIAQDNLKNYGKDYLLLNSSFQDALCTLTSNSVTTKFDYIFINGVLMYINDDELERCIKQLKDFMSEECTIYIKESIGIEERMTLNNFYSSDLNSNYSAIYRTKDVYRKIIDKVLIDEFNLKLIYEGDVFEESLKNRKETKDYYWIITK